MAIFSSIATAIAGALFGGSLFAANVIGAGLAFGAKLALSKLNKPKKQKFTAVQGEVQLGGDVPVSSLFGTGKTKGHRVYYAKWGSGNRLNTDIFVLANGWCDGLEPYVYFYGQKFNLVAQPKIGNEAAHYAIEGFGGYCSIRFYDGRPGQPADLYTVNNTAGLGNPWKATSRLSGLCYVIVDRVYKDHLFGKGRPDFEWVLRGLREYDPTKDSTVAGGNGPQRLADPSTWVHTKNPALHRLNYQLGVRGLRSGRTLIGEGKSLGQLDLASYFVAINYCRTLRKGKPIYECSLFVDGETDHTEALSAFDDAMAGYALNRRGLSGVVVGAPQIPVLTLTEADIPTDRPKPRQPRKSAFELYNHLSGQFTSPEAMWNPEGLKPIVVNADVAADKRARQTSIDFLQVSDPDIAQYLLNVRYRQNRKGGTKTQPVSRRVGLKVQEGEWIAVDGKDWMISEWRCEQDLRITLVLSETGADIYDDGAIQPGPIVIPPTPPVNPSLLFTVQNFAVAVGFITDASGVDVPALSFTWTPPNDPTITAVRFLYRINGQVREFQDQCTDPERGEYTTTKDVVGGVQYDARATITTVPDRLKDFTVWRTTAVATGPGLAPALIKYTNEATDWLRDGTRKLLDEQGRIARLIAEQDFANFHDKQTLRRELVARSDLITASYTEMVVAATGPGSAIVNRIQTLEAKVPGLATVTVVDALTARVVTTEIGISTVAGRTLTIENELPNKAAVSALNSLATTVTEQGNTISAQGLAITQINTVLPNKAETSAVTSLAGRVTNAEGAITANANAVTAVSTTVGRFSANGKFRIGVEATPAGALARIGFSASITEAGVSYEAAFFLDAMSGGKTRAVFNVGQFAIIDPNGTTPILPFIVDGGVVYIANVKIKQAQIDDLLVGTHNIQPGAITQYWIVNQTNGAQGDGVALQITAPHGANSPPLLIFSSIKAGLRTILKHRLLRSDTGLVLGSEGFVGTPAMGSAAIGIPAAQNEEYTNISAIYQPAPGDTATTFDLFVSNLGVPGAQQASWSDRKLVVLQLKR